MYTSRVVCFKRCCLQGIHNLEISRHIQNFVQIIEPCFNKELCEFLHTSIKLELYLIERMTESVEQKLKHLMRKAWRERWTDLMWGIYVKEVLQHSFKINI